MTDAEYEKLLTDDVGGFALDPLGFVLYAFPWGEPGTSLERHPGPRKWQIKILTEIGEELSAKTMDVSQVLRYATASGHGSGKSALVAWLVIWAMATCPDTRGIVTANTDTQLKTKTWPEVAKWHAMSIVNHWFTHTATAYYSTEPNKDRTWRIDCTPWSETNTEAFAGLHNEGKRILVIMDEASAISNMIWEVTEGALTDENTEIIWATFGNPTRTNGRFYDCFHKLSHRWSTRNIDCREVEGTNSAQQQEWLEDYGEDSDFFRYRVRGLFPINGGGGSISPLLIAEAMRRDPPTGNHYGVMVVGVDVGREGDDPSAFATRFGADASSVPIVTHHIPDNVKLANRLIEHIQEQRRRWNPDRVIVNIDRGEGAGVIDVMRAAGYEVNSVSFGGDADDVVRYGNKTTEMLFRLDDWLKDGGSLPEDPELEEDLAAYSHGHDRRDRRLQTKKADIKTELGRSPDRGDALKLTFANRYDIPTEADEEQDTDDEYIPRFAAR